jgi:hypothetical protein
MPGIPLKVGGPVHISSSVNGTRLEALFQGKQFQFLHHEWDLNRPMQAPEAGLGIQQRGSHPAKTLIPTVPLLHIPANCLYNRERRLDWVGARHRSFEDVLHPELVYGQAFFQPLGQTFRSRRVASLQFIVKMAERGSSLAVVGTAIGSLHSGTHRVIVTLSKMRNDVSNFVNLTSLEDSGWAGDLFHCFPESFRTIQHVKARHVEVNAALLKVGQ